MTLCQTEAKSLTKAWAEIGAGVAVSLTGAEVSYLLGFAPVDVKPNGNFHPLKVTFVP